MILIISNHDPNNRFLKKKLEEQGQKVIMKDQKSDLSDVNKKKVKGVILSGGYGPSLNKKINMDELRANLIVLLSYDVPILGICEGHEIIGQVYGGDVLKAKKEAKGELAVTILKRGKLLKGLPKKIISHESHENYVKKLPPNFELLASSRRTKIEAFQHKKKAIYGVQFHPERSGKEGEQILKNFVEICI